MAKRYLDGIHGAIADGLEADGYEARTTTLGESDHGLAPSVLDGTHILVWWSHCANDEVADRVMDAIHGGMGFVPLHSRKNAKYFESLRERPVTSSTATGAKPNESG